jgi:hypothetical protein
MKLFKLYKDDFNELCIPFRYDLKDKMYQCFCWYETLSEWRLRPRDRGYVTKTKLTIEKYEKLIPFIFDMDFANDI